LKNRNNGSVSCFSPKGCRNIYHFFQTGQFVVSDKVDECCHGCDHHQHNFPHMRNKDKKEEKSSPEENERLLAMNV
jgi:hypothetical protein